MKLVLVAFAFFSCGTCDGLSPAPRQVRVTLQFIEVAHPELTAMLAAKETSGKALHDKAFALSKNGKAKILETCMVVCPSGQKATLESIREEIFPTEYGPPKSAHPSSSITGILTGGPPKDPILREPTSWDTRNTGVTFEVVPSDLSNGTFELQLSPEIVTPLPLETWMEHMDAWGDGSIRMPIYESWRVATSINVKPGKFELVSSITPKPNAPVPAVSRKILVFVRADILPVPASP